MSLLLADNPSTFTVLPRNPPPVLQPNVWADNGTGVDVRMPLVESLTANYLASFGGRELFYYMGRLDPTGPKQGAIGNNETFSRYRFTTGPGCRFVRLVYVMGRDHLAFSANPKMRWTLTPISQAVSEYATTHTASYGLWAAEDPGEGPSSWITREVFMSVYPDRDYECTITSMDGGKLVTCLGFESTLGTRIAGNVIMSTDYHQNASANPTDSPGWPLCPYLSAKSLVLDADRQRMAASANELWKHGPTIFSWAVYDGTPLTGTGTILGGWHNTEGTTANRGSESNSRLKLKLSVYASNTGGTGTVSVFSEKGIAATPLAPTPLIAISGITTAGWYEATQYEHNGTLSAGDWGRLLFAFTATGGTTSLYSITLVVED